jgi:hypothetical protein
VGSPPRHRVGRNVTAGLQESEETRHDRQPPAHRGSRHPARLTPGIHRLQHTTLTSAAGPLSRDERQHISRLHLIGRLAHHREEGPQVRRGRQHRVRPAPPSQELQIHPGQRHPGHGGQLTGTGTRAGQA